MGNLEKDIKQKKFDNEHMKAFVNLVYTNNHFSSLIKKVFKKHHITEQQFNVLRILKGSYPETKTTGEVKEVMIDKSPDLTRLIDRLITKKLVERTNCPVDRRQVNLKIEQKGLDLIASIEPDVHQFSKILESISTEEAETLNLLLDKWRN